MSNKTTKETAQVEVQEQTTVKIFGQEIENRKYTLKEILGMARDRFQGVYEAGKLSYYFLGFRYYGLIVEKEGNSNEVIAQIVKRLLEMNEVTTKIKGSSIGCYWQAIKNGKKNVEEDFSTKRVSAKRATIDIDNLFVDFE